MTAPRSPARGNLRIVTAASLFDGHDAAINIMRRLIQDSGAEVIHLGHNRSVHEIVKAAVEEDAQAIAISSYQGGHNEFFRYLHDLLAERGAPHVRIFGGGGGVIVPDEIRALQAYGIARIYSPEDGRRMGLVGMIADLVERARAVELTGRPLTWEALRSGDRVTLARLITLMESGAAIPEDIRAGLAASERTANVVGLTGPGGAGKSSLTDELIRRALRDDPDGQIAVICVDPTRRRTGGALLGDRLRMNAVRSERVYLRSMATREAGGELSAAVSDVIAACSAAGFGLVLVESSGVGQGSSAIVDVSDVRVYVMTPEYGAPSQLEKIDMLDFADVVVLNKGDRRGAEDALRDVRRQVRRNRKEWHAPLESLPVFATVAARFGDPGVDRVYQHLRDLIERRQVAGEAGLLETGPLETGPLETGTGESGPWENVPIIPVARQSYLREIAASVRDHHAHAEAQGVVARRVASLRAAAEEMDEPTAIALRQRADAVAEDLTRESREIIDGWDGRIERYRSAEFVYSVRGREIRQPLFSESLSHLPIPRVAVPRLTDPGDRLRWTLVENFPGSFPYTAGVFPLKRRAEEPKRMFAGEGGPAKTNARFHYMCKGEDVARLSTAFDSVTLYGEDPDERPDIYGKVGESGVSIATLDDMKALYDGFDLCAKTTSVSMTINGPAPIILAMFLSAAIDQQIAAFTGARGRAPTEAEAADVAAGALRRVRGTVQADILKEDQAQNTCIFSLDFALRMMGDIQQYFIDHGVRNYYSVSVSGYHIAEAGANPVTQLAFTLANGFTLAEYYLSRGMDVDAFAPNISFFFSNGMDPEYTVIGRVARRIWAVAMRERYHASERSQKLKYHIQTSGRSLHAREIQFNDIRTTLQALLALSDNCNSLHTNAYDEAITTPTEESVRRAMAIQKICNREFGLLSNENSLQGSFIVDELTALVEEAVLEEFDRLDRRGGVLGAMETQYQRGRIQEESLHYERRKDSGELPIIGVNTFLDPTTTHDDWEPPEIELRRCTPEEKNAQIARLRAFQTRCAGDAPAALNRLAETARSGGNIFAELMRTVRVASLGQITRTLYEVGGEYRRNV